MDRAKAKSLEKELTGKVLNGYEVLEFINNGKSAAVFRAKKGGNLFALKIFDNELIERFGHEIQTKRIEQEISLKNHTVDNLVKIYEGDKTEVDGQEYYFIVMQLIQGVNLKEYIKTKTYGQDFILKVLEKLVMTTEQLLIQNHIVHRDIKPENIMVDDGGNIILMDLGVLKLIGAKSFSDEEEKSFVGTLRYAAPEFLIRTEEDSVDGWRAINIYQIGATLHDLIMKEELFNDKIPYANLVIAIKDDTPKVSNPDITFELLQLTRDMMTKNWKRRLELVTNDRLEKATLLKENLDTSFEQGIEEILKMRMGHEAKFEEIEKLNRTKTELRRRSSETCNNLLNEIGKCFDIIKSKDIFTSYSKSKLFYFNLDRNNKDIIIQNYLYEITGDLKMGFPRNLYILVRMSNNEENYTEIDLYGVFASLFIKPNLENPIAMFQEIEKEQQKPNLHNNYSGTKTINIFKGVISFDESFTNYLNTKILTLIIKALKMVEKNVQEELKWRAEVVSSSRTTYSRTIERSTIIIDSF